VYKFVFWEIISFSFFKISDEKILSSWRNVFSDI